MFCSIINGSTPSLRVYENKDVIGVLSIKPLNKGHVIIIPKKHVPIITQFSNDEVISVMNAVRTLTPILTTALKADGFNIFNNIGGVAGQVTAHAVIHLVPRYKDDDFDFEQKQVTNEELLSTQQLIINASKEQTIKLLKAISEGKVETNEQTKREAVELLRKLEQQPASDGKKKLEDLMK